MNRLQKKCLVTSALLHVVLIGSAIVGSAFLDQQPPEEKYPLLEIIPFKTTDELFSGGETPNAPPPNVRPDVPPLPPQAPVETPVRAASDPPPPVEPEPRKEIPPVEKPLERKKVSEPAPEPKKIPEVKDDPDSILPKKNKKDTTSKDPESAKTALKEKKEIKVNLDLAKRFPADAKADREKKRREEEAKAAAAQAARQAAAEKVATERAASIRGAVSALSGKLSKGTSVEIPGAGGEAYANYNSVVRTVYDNAWQDPGHGVDESLTVVASIEIRRDGSVAMDRTFITRRSGNDALDRSVQKALDRVRFVAPFPEGAKDEKRTFRIRFNLREKRMNG